MEGNEYGQRGTAPPASQSIKEDVRSLASDARQSASDVAGKARDQAEDLAQRRKDKTARSVGSLAGALRGVSRELRDHDEGVLGRYAERAAEQADRLAAYIGQRDLRGLVRDAEGFARRHPDLFLGTAFLGGVVAARFLKSTASHRETGRQESTPPSLDDFGAARNAAPARPTSSRASTSGYGTSWPEGGR
jgi:hypothetical protein